MVQDVPAYAGFLCVNAAMLTEIIQEDLYNTMTIIKEKLPVYPADHIVLFLPKIKRNLIIVDQYTFTLNSYMFQLKCGHLQAVHCNKVVISFCAEN